MIQMTDVLALSGVSPLHCVSVGKMLIKVLSISPLPVLMTSLYVRASCTLPTRCNPVALDV